MVIILFFPKDKKEVPLKVGEYTIELVGGKDGLKLSANKLSIKSAGQKVTVEFVPARGTLFVNTDDPDVEVLVKSSSKDIIRFFPKTKKEVPLAVGEYTIELVKGQDGSKLSTNKFVLKSGEQQTVTVEPILPSVEELLRTREVLTVAQDGSSGHKTIQEALDAVRPNQIILVKDKGPYRELINKALPADGLCSSFGPVNACYRSDGADRTRSFADHVNMRSQKVANTTNTALFW